MSKGFVLGNGLSRQHVDLDLLKQQGRIYGCNAIYRTFVPDVLVSTDTPISTAIQESGYSAKHTMYTRKPIAGLGALSIPKPYFGYSSGPVAVALAALEQHEKIYMLGFDLGPTEDNKFNNLYAGTEFYKDPGSAPTYTGNWVKQIQQICREFSNTKFVRVCGKTTARVQELDGIVNMEHLLLDGFIERINNVKDL